MYQVGNRTMEETLVERLKRDVEEARRDPEFQRQYLEWLHRLGYQEDAFSDEGDTSENHVPLGDKNSEKDSNTI